MASRRRRLALRVIFSILIPLLALGAGELVLRLCGYGHDTSFFVEAPDDLRGARGETLLVENPRFSWRFFPPRLARAPMPMAIAREKPPGTLRVVTFGESATKGEPEPAFGFPRLLEVLLEERLGRDVEVINVAVTAISSHVIRAIAQDCVRLDADVWIVYAGNNEVLGPFGAGSIFGARSPSRPVLHASLWAKSTRLGQWLGSLFSSLLGAVGPKDGDAPTSWRGMDMFLDEQFRLGDERLEPVYESFEANLEDIVELGLGAGAQIIVSTVVSNLRDCPPFASLHRESLDASDLVVFNEAYDRGVALDSKDDLAGARAAYEIAWKLDPTHAELRFRLGRLELRASRPAEAYAHLLAARDLDTIRFRTDSRLNEITRRVARARGLALVDAERSFASASADGVPGEEWLYEHVHLTFDGNLLLARLLAEATLETTTLETTTLETTGAPEPAARAVGAWPDASSCGSRLGWCPWAERQTYLTIRNRLEEPPYSSQLGHALRRARLDARIESLAVDENSLGVDAERARFESAIERRPRDAVLLDQFGSFLASKGETAAAERAWRRALEILPHHFVTRYRLAMQIADADPSRLEEASREIEETLRRKPTFAEALLGLGRAFGKHGRHDDAARSFERALEIDPSLSSARVALAEARLAGGHADAAIAVYDGHLERRPDDVFSWLRLAQLRGQHAGEDAAIHTLRAARDAVVKLASVEKRAAVSYELGLALSRRKLWSAARPEFETVRKLEPGNTRALFALGQVHLELGDPARALEAFLAVKELRPADSVVDPYIDRARREAASSAPSTRRGEP